MMHHIQKAILDTLATSESCRYAELKPAELDGNVFGYHLKQVIAAKLAYKDEDGNYSLTPLGRDYIVNRYEDPLTQAHSIILIVIRRGNQWLMRKRLVQPLIGYIGFVHGEPVAGEAVTHTAQQRLLSKTGITASLTLFSSGLITQYKDGELASYSHALIMTGETTDDDTIASDTTGEQQWCTLAHIQQQPELFLPSCVDIIERITRGDRSVFELLYRQDT